MLFLNYCAKNHQELETLDELARRATVLQANRVGDYVNGIKEFLVNEEIQLWKVIDRINTRKYIGIVSTLQDKIDRSQPFGRMETVRTFNEWKKKYTNMQIEEMILKTNDLLPAKPENLQSITNKRSRDSHSKMNSLSKYTPVR